VSTEIVSTPIGPLALSASPKGLTGVEFLRADLPVSGGNEDGDGAAIVLEAARQLEEYFDGERRAFDLPLDLKGTEFQLKVWQAIAAVGYGETVSYAAIATVAGRPTAYRAAGTACGANRVAIVIPCHRIVGSDRGLRGFGSGLNVKRWLLEHEARSTGGAGVFTANGRIVAPALAGLSTVSA
jgi:methylated-DNA-[protein]-cysteine S-methyltransferase